FDKLEALAGRLPEKPVQKPALVWPWTATTIDRSSAADKLVEHLGKRPPTVLIPYISQMGYWGKRKAIEKLKDQKKWDDATRDTFFAMIGDKDYYVRGEALKALENCTIDEARALQLEDYLSRKNSDMRRAVFTLLRRQKQPA